MGKSKLGLYIIQGGTDAIEWVRQAQPRVVVTMNLDADFVGRIKAASPSTLLMGRLYQDNEPFTDPAHDAERFYVKLKPYAERLRGLIHVWMAHNESIISGPVSAMNLNDFYVRLGDLAHSDGFKIAAYSFSTGNPALELWPYLVDGLRHCDYLSLHEYSAPRMETQVNWLCLRYRKVYAALPADARRPLIVGECGIDGGVIDKEHDQWGWRKFTKEVGYLPQLQWYDRHLQEDNYVVGAAIYAADDWGKDGSFGMVKATMIRDYIGTAAPSPAPVDEGLEIAVRLIKEFEGFSPVPYTEPNGTQSIGYGHNIGKKEKFTQITEEQASALLAADITRYAERVRKSVKVALTPNQFGALVSLCYNIGVGAFGASDLVEKLNKGDSLAMPSEFVRWRWAAKQQSEGLYWRRCNEAAKFLGFSMRK